MASPSPKRDGADTTLTPDQLAVGMQVHLDLSWFEHPFPKSSFVIADEAQLTTVRGLGLRRVRVSIHSSAQPGQPTPDAPPASETEPLADAALQPEGGAQPTEHERSLRAQQAAQKRCEKALAEAARRVRALSRSLHAQPDETRENARALVGHLAGDMLAEADLALLAMADRVGGEKVYHHALNTTLMSMMLARAMKAPQPAMESIGLAALFHDIGKFEIPERITRKTEPLTRAESNWLAQHPALGVQLAVKLGLPEEVQQVIAQHHERFDGSGYPNKLSGNDISLLTRIIMVANAYDNLCNPADVRSALTPHEALASLYAKQRGKFEPKVLDIFIKCMGIYPPGTVVGLSDGRLALVMAVNATQPLKPRVLLHEPSVPRQEALLLDLNEQPGLTIVKAVRPENLDPAALAYLAPSERTTYYFSAEARSPTVR